jgi:hypothetical protein
VRIAWSRPLPAAPLGISLAREPGFFLVHDVEGCLTRLDRLGQPVVRRPAPAALSAAAFADDGSSVAALGKRGQVWMMTSELGTMWERSLPRRGVAAALDPLGKQLAVADEAGGVHVFDAAGKVMWTATAARPLVHLAFIPEEPILVGSAEFGLVCAFDRTGKLLWRDGLVAHVGSLAVSGDGGRIALACFTEGLCCYSLAQPRQVRLPKAPARLAALSYTGGTILTAGLDGLLALRDAEGVVRDEVPLPALAVGIAVEALGESALAVLASSEVVRVDLPGEAKKTGPG